MIIVVCVPLQYLRRSSSCATPHVALLEWCILLPVAPERHHEPIRTLIDLIDCPAPPSAVPCEVMERICGDGVLCLGQYLSGREREDVRSVGSALRGSVLYR